MMDAMMTGLERSLVGFTYVYDYNCFAYILMVYSLWNYNPANTDTYGDDWNGENFSWFSQSRALPAQLLDYEQTSPTLDNGGRILTSIVRPYPAKTCGIPLKIDYEMNSGTLYYEWANHVDPSLALRATETEIFYPSLLAQSRKLKVSGLEPGDRCVWDERRQTVFICCGDVDTPGKIHRIEISLFPSLDANRPEFFVNDLWSDFGSVAIYVFIFLFFALAAFTAYHLDFSHY